MLLITRAVVTWQRGMDNELTRGHAASDKVTPLASVSNQSPQKHPPGLNPISFFFFFFFFQFHSAFHFESVVRMNGTVSCRIFILIFGYFDGGVVAAVASAAPSVS